MRELRSGELRVGLRYGATETQGRRDAEGAQRKPVRAELFALRPN